MYESARTFANQTENPVELILEPWALSVVLPVGAVFTVVARADQAGELEIVEEDGIITAYAWPGSTAAVYQGESLIADMPLPVPEVPAGMSTRLFLDLVLGRGSDEQP